MERDEDAAGFDGIVGTDSQVYSSSTAADGDVFTVSMSDSWGDGWNGGYLSVTSAGGGTNTTLTLSYGTSGSDSFTVACP